MPTFADLHDATLRRLELDWVAGELRCRMTTGLVPGHPVVTLIAVGVTRLSCPRTFPWGPSESVNTVTVEAQGGGCLLQIEMQSGDLIEATAESVRLESERSN